MNHTTLLSSPRRGRRNLLSYAGTALLFAGAASVVFALLAALSTAMPPAVTTVPDSAVLLRPAQDGFEQEPRQDLLDCVECVRGNHGWESVA